MFDMKGIDADVLHVIIAIYALGSCNKMAVPDYPSCKKNGRLSTLGICQHQTVGFAFYEKLLCACRIDIREAVFKPDSTSESPKSQRTSLKRKRFNRCGAYLRTSSSPSSLSAAHTRE